MAKQGRLELLAWLNEYLETDYPKIENLCDGVAFCQLFDAILPPGSVPLYKLNFSAKFPDDYTKNFKVLDEVFQKNEILKAIPISQLVKGKFQENKEFLQWCYNYMYQQFPDGLPLYRAYHRRELALKKGEGKPQSGNSNLLPNKFSSVDMQPSKSGLETVRSSKTKIDTDAQAEKQAKELEQLISSLEVELKETLLEMHDFSNVVQRSKKERDFYFSKLIAIEKLCKEKYPNDPYTSAIMQTFTKEVPGFKQLE